MMPDRFRFSLALIIMAVTFSVVILLVRPAVYDVLDAKRNAEIENQKLTRTREINDNFKKIKQGLENNADLISRSEKALPTLAQEVSFNSASDVPQLLELLQEMSSKESPGTVIRSVRIETIESETDRTTLVGALPGEVKKRSVSVEGVASYEGLKRLLSASSDSLRLLDPNSLTFIISGDRNVVDFNFVVDAYTQMGCRGASCRLGQSDATTTAATEETQ